MNTVNQPEHQSSEAMTQEEYERDHPCLLYTSDAADE